MGMGMAALKGSETYARFFMGKLPPARRQKGRVQRGCMLHPPVLIQNYTEDNLPAYKVTYRSFLLIQRPNKYLGVMMELHLSIFPNY